MFEQPLFTDSSTIVSVFLVVYAIDKTFYNGKLQSLDSNRKWHLPLISMVVGAIAYIFMSDGDLKNIDFKEVIWKGILLGAFSTVGYKIIKKAIIEKIQSFASGGNAGLIVNDNSDEDDEITEIDIEGSTDGDTTEVDTIEDE